MVINSYILKMLLMKSFIVVFRCTENEVFSLFLHFYRIFIMQYAKYANQIIQKNHRVIRL